MTLSNLNHPVKELIWVCRRTDALAINQWNNFTDTKFTYTNPNTVSSGNLALTDDELISLLNISGDTPSTDIVQGVLDTNFGNITDGNNPVITGELRMNGTTRFDPLSGRYFNLVQPYQHHTSTPTSGVNVYSFALSPEEH